MATVRECSNWGLALLSGQTTGHLNLSSTHKKRKTTLTLSLAESLHTSGYFPKCGASLVEQKKQTAWFDGRACTVSYWKKWEGTWQSGSPLPGRWTRWFIIQSTTQYVALVVELNPRSSSVLLAQLASRSWMWPWSVNPELIRGVRVSPTSPASPACRQDEVHETRGQDLLLPLWVYWLTFLIEPKWKQMEERQP